jgi:hypothetical protein
LNKIIQKYKTIKDLRTQEPKAYNAIYRLGLEDLITHFERNTLSISDQELIDLGKKYENKKDFIGAHKKEYNLAASRGILDKVVGHMKNTYRKSNLTDEDIVNIAKQYKYRSDFIEGNANAYLEAQKRGILDQVTSHMEVHPNKSNIRKYSREELELIAKKYQNKRDFNANDRNAYAAASSYGILDDITQHMETLGSKSNRMVYAYEFPDYNMAYVGLTYNEEQRKRAHTEFENERKKQSSVLKFMLEKNVQPIYKNISNGYIDYKDAQKLEHDTLEIYKDNGWETLNRAKTGGLGGLAFHISNQEIEDVAKNYQTKSEFKKNEPNIYQLASRRKLIPNVTQHMSSKLTFFDFDDIMKIASKYQSKTEFSVKSPKAYSAAVRKGWIEDVTKHMTGNSKFSDQELEKIAKGYKTKMDFKKGNRRAYSRAVARGIIDKISTHMVKPPIHNLKYSKEDFIAAAKKYKTRANLYKNDKKLYHAASKREGMFDLMFPPK